MCYRYEREFEPGRRDEPARLPPLVPPRVRRRVVGAAVTVAVAAVAALTLPEWLNAGPEPATSGAPVSAATPAVESAAPLTPVAMSAQPGGASLVQRAVLGGDDEVAPAAADSKPYGGCHHD